MQAVKTTNCKMQFIIYVVLRSRYFLKVASANALQGMIQDTAEELNGRFTALQMSGASIDLKMDRIQTTIQQISGINSGIAESIALSVGIANDQLNVLEDIRNNTRELVSILNHLSRIESQMAIVTGE